MLRGQDIDKQTFRNDVHTLISIEYLLIDCGTLLCFQWVFDDRRRYLNLCFKYIYIRPNLKQYMQVKEHMFTSPRGKKANYHLPYFRLL